MIDRVRDVLEQRAHRLQTMRGMSHTRPNASRHGVTRRLHAFVTYPSWRRLDPSLRASTCFIQSPLPTSRTIIDARTAFLLQCFPATLLLNVANVVISLLRNSHAPTYSIHSEEGFGAFKPSATWTFTCVTDRVSECVRKQVLGTQLLGMLCETASPTDRSSQ